LHSNFGARLHDEINLLPLSLQPLNLHYHEGLELREPADVNPANSAAESFLQNSDHNFQSDDESGNSESFGADLSSWNSVTSRLGIIHFEIACFHCQRRAVAHAHARFYRWSSSRGQRCFVARRRGVAGFDAPSQREP
jgi:hypothetical protein